MPVRKTQGGWKIGKGTAVYKRKKDALSAYKAYLAKKDSK